MLQELCTNWLSWDFNPESKAEIQKVLFAFFFHPKLQVGR
jgi:hypothetical protein